MTKKIISAVFSSLFLLAVLSAAVYAGPDYDSIYAESLEEALARHNEMISRGSAYSTSYNRISYAYSDITDDGYKELIVIQVVSKHAAEYWVYSYNGSSVDYMGDFECDADQLYGYRKGILYRESYKGGLGLYAAEWNGSGFTVQELYWGSYDRNGTPPEITDLSAYYDSDRLLEKLPEFRELSADSYGNAGLYASEGSGSTQNADRFDLSNYVHRTVVTTDSRGALVFQSSPNGSFMFDYQFWNGDDIYVNLTWRQDGYAIAYKNGVYGYVDASYINWDVAPASSSDDVRYNLSNFAYRAVVTGGRGALVFQKSPNGSFMYDYEYWDGDQIYVNLTWRQDGYAIACQNGVYGYVDASYISW